MIIASPDAVTRTTNRFAPVVSALLAASLSFGVANAQTVSNTSGAGLEPQTPSAQQPTTRDWTYGGFVDLAYLNAFNDPPNKIFRGRGTAWHVDDWYLNMTGAYVKKRASDHRGGVRNYSSTPVKTTRSSASQRPRRIWKAAIFCAISARQMSRI